MVLVVKGPRRAGRSTIALSLLEKQKRIVVWDSNSSYKSTKETTIHSYRGNSLQDFFVYANSIKAPIIIDDLSSITLNSLSPAFNGYFDDYNTMDDSTFSEYLIDCITRLAFDRDIVLVVDNSEEFNSTKTSKSLSIFVHIDATAVKSEQLFSNSNFFKYTCDSKHF